ncbi:integrase catalytic domain-containing protein [Trichonephila clavipes]|nr:integrase catalytic domain-containing protein [Trichonephila clavipes]
MFKNCRKEDLRIVALELELIPYTIEDRKRAEEDRKRVRVEEDRKKEAENRLREKELELARLNVRVNSDNERTGEACNTLNALVKSVRILTVKVPNRPEAITEDLVPKTKIDFNLNNIPNLKLADKNFNIPERVQMLLGADVFYELMLPGQFKTEGSNIIFQNTVFGFIVSGSTSSDAQGKEHCGFIQAADNLEHSIKKFWEIENVEIDSVKTSELDICEDHFKNTHSRDDQGKYTVAMPLKEDPSCLEYEDLGHMREIKADESGVSFYMPHHGVYHPEKSTTKLRTVFNASNPSTSGKSLN